MCSTVGEGKEYCRLSLRDAGSARSGDATGAGLRAPSACWANAAGWSATSIIARALNKFACLRRLNLANACNAGCARISIGISRIDGRTIRVNFCSRNTQILVSSNLLIKNEFLRPRRSKRRISMKSHNSLIFRGSPLNKNWSWSDHQVSPVSAARDPSMESAPSRSRPDSLNLPVPRLPDSRLIPMMRAHRRRVRTETGSGIRWRLVAGCADGRFPGPDSGARRRLRSGNVERNTSGLIRTFVGGRASRVALRVSSGLSRDAVRGNPKGRDPAEACP